MQAEPDNDQPTILIVDDERVNRSMLAELLGQQYRVLLAKDGPSALTIAARESHRLLLVLLDVSMPGMNGYEVLTQLKKQEATAGIAIIFITGQSDAAAEEYGLRLGAADYVSKPIRPAVVSVRVRNQIDLALQRQALQRLAQVDGLTSLANRRHFDDMLRRSHRMCLRRNDPLGLALIDIDHFKLYNDHYGHVQGDEALKQVAGTLARHARRPYDLAARFGGEEFALILPGHADAVEVVERFRLEVQSMAIAHAASTTAPELTVSCGVLTIHCGQTDGMEDCLRRADELLYEAKTSGRNRVCATSVGL
ncbi:diguanylate cyclase [Comamonas sp. JUb58]|uniref:diguanylate cyclase n=1 Tax=Comamonas sp. JUb58 TaxID=2485114 RepID=UPI0010612C78|nr:diguanylate cyclase [Comamonas sp. JUb58]TDS75372.1 response regulator receiver modulated diguanylate cyclase [Comamonas sp. JUb58]